MIRKQAADLEARKCKPVKTPLAGWRSSGHFPIIASIKQDWQPWRHNISNIREKPVQVPELETIVAMDDVDLQQFQQAVKAHREVKSKRIQMPQLQNVDQEVYHHWQQQAESRMRARTDGSVDAAKDAERKKELKREMRRLARRRKRAALMETLKLVGEAQQAGDAHVQYQFIRKVCPKSFRRRICLKTDQGGIMSNEEECDNLAEYAKQLFEDEPYDLVPRVASAALGMVLLGFLEGCH